MNFDNKNAIKRKFLCKCKFLYQIIFCNVEFAQNCRKFEFSGGKIEFHGKKSSFAIFGQNEFPSKRTKKEPEITLIYIIQEREIPVGDRLTSTISFTNPTNHLVSDI